MSLVCFHVAMGLDYLVTERVSLPDLSGTRSSVYLLGENFPVAFSHWRKPAIFFQIMLRPVAKPDAF